jgi:hypothetical protein
MYFFGLDLGKRRDPSTLAILHRPDPNAIFSLAGPEPPQLILRHLETMKLRTPYTDVVARIAEIAAKPAVAGTKHLAVDATGVGEPVVEMIVKAKLPCGVMPVMLTSGYGEHKDGRIWRVPKLDLYAGLQAAFERGEVKISKRLPELSQLMKELTDVKIEIGPSRKIHLGAEGYEQHDDRVIALALAAWAAKHHPIAEPNQRLFW